MLRSASRGEAADGRGVESFSFAAPLGETLLYLMLASGLRPDFARCWA